MSDLIEFLLARIAEDEAVARAVIAEYPRHDDVTNHVCYCDGQAVAALNGHRLLAECEAKRRIVHEAREINPDADYGDVDNLDDGQVWAFGDVLQALALPYADHPDYRDEWRR